MFSNRLTQTERFILSSDWKIRRIGLSVECNEKLYCLNASFLLKRLLKIFFHNQDCIISDLKMFRLSQFINMGSRPPAPSSPFQITFGRYFVYFMVSQPCLNLLFLILVLPGDSKYSKATISKLFSHNGYKVKDPSKDVK